MTISKSETQITWSAAASVSVATAGAQTSDAFTFGASSFNAMITCKADNAGTPAAQETVDFYLLYTTGDPDGASSDEYDTTLQGTYLGQVDTYAADPAQRTFSVNPAAKGGKIYAKSNAATNAITVSATLYEISG